MKACVFIYTLPWRPALQHTLIITDYITTTAPFQMYGFLMSLTSQFMPWIFLKKNHVKMSIKFMGPFIILQLCSKYFILFSNGFLKFSPYIYIYIYNFIIYAILCVYSVAYFSLDLVEICTEHPRNP